MSMLDVRAHNRAAWDNLNLAGDKWTLPVSPEEVARARKGEWQVLLTNSTPVPRAWFPAQMRGARILALASGGGQQAPLFAAAGADVTVLDNSPEQLAKDRLVAQREGLMNLRAVEGTMEDLSAFDDATFDLVFNPASLMFTKNVRRVWQESARVLRPGGALLSGFLNPLIYLFDRPKMDAGVFELKYRVPHEDARDLPPEEVAAIVGRREPLEHSHTLTDLIGGQLDAGLHLVAMYEDRFGDAPIDAHHPGLIATRAVKASRPAT